MMTGTYDLTLVTLSFIVAVMASYVALELSARVARYKGKIALFWLVAGGFSMGFGIWTMHFVGMLAFEMRMPYSYDVPITVLSLLIGIIASTFAIWIASRKSASFAKIGFSGLLLGGGVASMHYTGMAAMRMQATVIYDPTVLALSVLIAVVAATAAIWIIFTLVQHRAKEKNLAWFKVAAALIMGVAICGMHYTGMAAASYEPFENAVMLAEPQSNPSMAMQLAFAALLFLGITHLTIFFDVRISKEQKRGKAALMRASQMSDLLDESLNEILVIDIPTLRMTNVNKGACEHLGYERDQLLSMSPMDISPGLTEEAFCDRLMQLADSTDRISVYESVHQRSDGSVYPVEVHLQLSNILERPVALVIASDISERKTLEGQLVQAQKMESIGQLAAGIAHEINTPAQYVGDNTRFIKETMVEVIELVDTFQRLHAASVEGNVTPDLLKESGDLIQNIDPEFLKEEVPAAIDQSLEGITHITNIVRAMKVFSHPGGVNQEMIDINKTIESTITVASNEWKYVANVETDLDESLPAVPCMPQEISQVVLNLIVNAAHAIAESLPEGSDAKGTITIKTVRAQDYAEIRITDTGGGIPEHVRDRIFDPFFTTKEVGKGTGQGLTMAHRTIVNNHKGDLRFETHTGQGTTFVISLPLESVVDEAMQVVA